MVRDVRQAVDVIQRTGRRFLARRRQQLAQYAPRALGGSQLPVFAGRMAAAAVAGVAARRALTQTRRQNTGRQIEVAGGESKSYFTSKNPKAAASPLVKGVASNVITRTSGAAFSTTQGVQNAVILGSYFDAVDLLAFTNIMGLNSAPYGATKFYAESIHGKLILTNAESTNVHLTLYDCLAKQHMNSGNTSPYDIFTAGLVDAAGGAAANYIVPGTTPYVNPRFKETYKILQRTEIILSPGATHTHVVSYEPQRMVSKLPMAISGQTAGPISGLSVYTLGVLHGTPVHDATTETSVTLGAAKVDYVLMEEAKYKLIQYSYPNNSISNSLAINLTGEQMLTDAPTDAPDTS